MTKYKKGALSGGMARGIYQLGSLMYMHEQDYLDELELLQGSSVGSILSFYILSGRTPMQAFQFVFNTNIEFTIADMDVVNANTNWGMFNIEKLIGYVAEGVKDCYADPHELTFEEMYKITGKTLVVVATNTSTYEGDRFSHLTHPKAKVLKVIGMSANLPILFTRNSFDDTYYVDAGISDNFPFADIDDGESAVFGIDTTAGAVYPYHPRNMLEYVYRISIIPILRAVKSIRKSDKMDVIRIDERIEDMGYVFTVPADAKWSMFSHGYKTTKRYYENKEIGV